MPGLTRAQVRRLLEVQGLPVSEPDFTEVVFRVDALIAALNNLDALDLARVEPWPSAPETPAPQRRSGATPAGALAQPHTNEAAFMTIGEQARLISERRLSPVELVREYLDRVDRYDPHLHAFNLVFREEALTQARRAEEQIAAGNHRGPLHGIPVGIKDQFDIEGHPNTGGCDAFAQNVAAVDCTIVARLRQAGAIILGSLATHEFHMGGTLEFLNGGIPRNPWDLTRTPAGSSAGSAASVAAGLLSGSIGADTGGSIRGPASVNGITGLRPSWGRVSRQGGFSLAWEMDAAGPLTRSAEDAAIMLQAIAGHDPADPTSSRARVPDYRSGLGGNLRGLRIGVVQEMLGDAIQPETRSLVEQAIRVLSDLGAKVEPVSLPLLQRMQGVHTAVCDSQAASYHRAALRERYELYDRNTRVRVLVGAVLPAGLVTLAHRARALLASSIIDAFGRFDVMAGATGIGPAGPIATRPAVINAGAARTAVAGGGSTSSLFSMAGVPAISVPAGFTPEGLPVGLHLAAGRFDEPTLLRAAHAFQQATTHHQQHPPMLWAPPR